MCTARVAKTLDNGQKESTRATGWFDHAQIGEVTIGGKANKIKDKIDNPPTRKHFAMLIIEVDWERRRRVRHQAELGISLAK
jgi:hypothetical protein